MAEDYGIRVCFCCLKSRPWRDAPQGRRPLLKRSAPQAKRSSKVRISPGWARWVGEKIWHESQKITKLPNGSLEMTFRVAGLDEIKRWVLSFGPECQVLEPEELKEMVRKDLSRNLAQYSKPRSSFILMKEMRAI